MVRGMGDRSIYPGEVRAPGGALLDARVRGVLGEHRRVGQWLAARARVCGRRCRDRARLVSEADRVGGSGRVQCGAAGAGGAGGAGVGGPASEDHGVGAGASSGIWRCRRWSGGAGRTDHENLARDHNVSIGTAHRVITLLNQWGVSFKSPTAAAASSALSTQPKAHQRTYRSTATATLQHRNAQPHRVRKPQPRATVTTRRSLTPRPRCPCYRGQDHLTLLKALANTR